MYLNMDVARVSLLFLTFSAAKTCVFLTYQGEIVDLKPPSRQPIIIIPHELLKYFTEPTTMRKALLGLSSMFARVVRVIGQITVFRVESYWWAHVPLTTFLTR